MATRQAKFSFASEVGINEQTIALLVERFYARVRSDDKLAPFFEARISDWGAHLSTMNDFWVSLTLESGRFHGSPMIKHVTIGDVRASDFRHWLDLFNETLLEVFEDRRAIDLFEAKAQRIAESLWAGIQIHRDNQIPKTLGI